MTILGVLVFIVVRRRRIIRPEHETAAFLLEIRDSHFTEAGLAIARFPVVQVDPSYAATGSELPPKGAGVIVESRASRQTRISVVECGAKSGNVWYASGSHLRGGRGRRRHV
jgi:hypothetical protein